jgi:hypothetical protein
MSIRSWRVGGGRDLAIHCPNLTEFVEMGMDQGWVDRSPQTMLETFHWFRGEGFGLVIEALLALPPGQGIIAEGFRLLPHLVKPLVHDPSHCVWLNPTPAFRLAALKSRGSMWSIPNKTSNPNRALSNLLETRSALHRASPGHGRDDRPARRHSRRQPDGGRARELHRCEFGLSSGSGA